MLIFQKPVNCKCKQDLNNTIANTSRSLLIKSQTFSMLPFDRVMLLLGEFILIMCEHDLTQLVTQWVG